MSSIAIYVQKGESKYREYFAKNINRIREGMGDERSVIFFPELQNQLGAHFIKVLKDYLHVYYPGFSSLLPLQQEQIVYLLDSAREEFELYQFMEQMLGLNLQNGAYLFFVKPGHLSYDKLDEDMTEEKALRPYLPYLYVQFQSFSKHSSLSDFDDSSIIGEPSSSVFSRKGLAIMLKSIIGEKDEFTEIPKGIDFQHHDKDEAILNPEMERLFAVVNEFGLTDALKQLLMFAMENVQKSINTSDQPKSLLKPLERVHFNYEGNLFVGEQKVDLNPLCRSLYKLFLNHPEGIELRNMAEHREELFGYYRNFATHTDIGKLKRSVSDLCDPRENSINEKLSMINRKFASVLGDQICVPYQILGPRGEAKKINLRAEFR
jgi:hypothetical protein